MLLGGRSILFQISVRSRMRLTLCLLYTFDIRSELVDRFHILILLDTVEYNSAASASAHASWRTHLLVDKPHRSYMSWSE
jgi:hypothetical protein